MFPQGEPIVFASRATALIVAACRSARRSVVLLPALYCPDVAEAIEAGGLVYRCYDVPSSLSSTSSLIDLEYGSDVGTVIVLHPFGLARAPNNLTLPEETLLIEDACHAPRTAINIPALGSVGQITIFSPRKEFGWSEGGIAVGPLATVLKREVSPAAQVADRWQQQDIAALAQGGWSATRLAIAALGDKLPPVVEGEVTSVLPLKSARRDATIERLRAAGFEAWRWLRPLRHAGPEQTPQAWKLLQKLFLVPLLSGTEFERLLELLRDEPLESWG
jgi:hypothetical protein